MTFQLPENLKNPKALGILGVICIAIVVLVLGPGSTLRGAVAPEYPHMMSKIGPAISAIHKEHDGDERAIQRLETIVVRDYIAKNAHFIGQQDDRRLLATYYAISDIMCRKSQDDPLEVLAKAIEAGVNDKVERQPLGAKEYEAYAKSDIAGGSVFIGSFQVLSGDPCGLISFYAGTINAMSRADKMRFIGRQLFSKDNVGTMMVGMNFLQGLIPN